MKHAAFLAKLDVVSGAIADKDIMPVFKHIWFTGEEMVTYDSQIGISIAHKTKFKGGVPESLIGLVKVTDATDVEIDKVDDTLELKFGNVQKDKSIKWRAKPDKLAMMVESVNFDMPEFNPKKTLAVNNTTDFVTSIKSCMRSVKEDISAPEFLGITLIAKERKLDMYSFDNKSLSIEHAALKNDAPFKRVIISSQFCRQLIKLSSDAKDIKISITDEYSLAVIDNNIKLFGNLIGEKDTPMDFEEVIKRNVPATYIKNIEIPARLKQAIKRALIITGEAADEAKTIVTVKENRLIIESKSKALGTVSDRIPLNHNHPEVTITIRCKELERDIDTFTRMFIAERCWIMMNKESMYVVSGV